MLLALKRALCYVYKPFFRDCVYTLSSEVCYWGVPMFIFASGKGRYTKKCILADKRYADINGRPTNGTRGR